mgnify:CR=1 FL=1
MNTSNILCIALIFMSCSFFTQNESIESKYDRAILKFQEEKYSKSRDILQLVLDEDRYNNEARFYYAESLYKLKNYSQAMSEYNQYILNSITDSDRVEYSRYMLCLSQYYSISDYNKDSKDIFNTIDQIQFFIESYNKSNYNSELEDLLVNLRSMLARKEFESARLYLKLEQYDASRLYMENIINNYYDTEYVDDAILGMIISFCLQNDYAKAQTVYNNNLEKLNNEFSASFAKDLLDSSKVGLSTLYKIYIKWN